jgi:hypothetical protein
MLLEKLLLLPLFLHVVLILWVGARSLSARIKSVVGGQTKLSSIALESDAWPNDVRKLGNNFDNQFQVPMLWYAVCGLIIITVKPDWICISLSWGFLVARVLHSMVHTGSNNVPLRMRMFLASVAFVMAMWAWFAIRLFVIG